MWCQMSILLKLQQILKSPEPLQRRTKGGWQSVSGLNRALFAQTPLRTKPKNIVWGQNQEKDRIWYPSHYHILSPPFKSHLPGLEVKAVFAIWYPGVAYISASGGVVSRNPICTFYLLPCASFNFFFLFVKTWQLLFRVKRLQFWKDFKRNIKTDIGFKMTIHLCHILIVNKALKLTLAVCGAELLPCSRPHWHNNQASHNIQVQIFLVIFCQRSPWIFTDWKCSGLPRAMTRDTGRRLKSGEDKILYLLFLGQKNLTHTIFPN